MGRNSSLILLYMCIYEMERTGLVDEGRATVGAGGGGEEGQGLAVQGPEARLLSRGWKGGGCKKVDVLCGGRGGKGKTCGLYGLWFESFVSSH